jgi:phosphoenolpyruvate carboxykinase (GTP)
MNIDYSLNLNDYKEKFADEGDFKKITALENPKINAIIATAIKILQPKDVMVFDDSDKDEEKVRKLAIERGEEMSLKMEGHTIHYDHYNDLARDKGNTKTLLPEGETLSRGLVTAERNEALKEMEGLMNGVMKGKTMLVSFYSLGPNNSEFTICALQITDSFYVVHSENILYRKGYSDFMRLKDKNNFFYFWHSAGELDEENKSKNTHMRKIFIDPMEERVFSVNNQYAGNSLACKKLALRLAINRANKKGEWLAEHMFISGFKPIKGGRTTYFAGAYPSACGKTSTAMIPGSKIVGDDIAYIRKGPEGEMRAVNIEQGIFGIIADVNEKDDPEIFKVLNTPREMIFSNVLYTPELEVFWQGCGKPNLPTEGINHSGKWYKGKKDSKTGAEIPISHPNSRYTIKIEALANCDKEYLHEPKGVKISGILYGGRDPDTLPPCYECLTWEQGVTAGASIESVPTSATLGNTSTKPVSSPMANMDFLIVKLGKYLQNHINFGRSLKHCPKVFITNYFLCDDKGNYLNTKLDKAVWITWFEGRCHGEYDGIKTPIGYLPKYEDLEKIFAHIFNGRKYTKEEYVAQFSLRVDKLLAKNARMRELYKDEEGVPKEFFEELDKMDKGLNEMKTKFGKSVISPFEL